MLIRAEVALLMTTAALLAVIRDRASKQPTESNVSRTLFTGNTHKNNHVLNERGPKKPWEGWERIKVTLSFRHSPPQTRPLGQAEEGYDTRQKGRCSPQPISCCSVYQGLGLGLGLQQQLQWMSQDPLPPSRPF